ncbi:citrate/2-methylcitrate synthase [Methanosarcina barkeri]|uniref:citrate/2-methylcitrate synthase n=1 Tax=Methanosarcina barkeri TaxID=2208 RepID=UPI000B2B4760|nr:citrate/2-methylcitrate synthase [Methanosarcina barkeri]
MSKNICFIDGLEGILKYRDIDINQLVDLPMMPFPIYLSSAISLEIRNLPSIQPACMGSVKSTGR